MIIINCIILYFIQIRHTDDFPSTGIPANNNNNNSNNTNNSNNNNSNNNNTNNINTLSAKDGDLRLSASNACLPKTESSVFVTECVFFTSTCYKLHMFTLHDVLYS